MEKRRLTAFFSTVDIYLYTSLRLICIVCLALLLALLIGNVFVRYVPFTAFYWFDEVVEWLFAWMIFFGAAALWSRNDHFKLEWISKKLSGTTAGHLLACIVELLSLFFLLIFFYQALRLTMLARDWTPVFNIPRRCLYVCMPLSGAIMVCYSIRNVIRELMLWRKEVVQTKTPLPTRNTDL
ncbi:TRAP transporter small permease [Desulfofustis glycolicus]|uniref:TRAP-type C4-dicarboxylate transport system, small permease component n=1 Tax=Desulfofustis glycolicus DSM 9705 TaxID=1121409 RepID=A0A1M5UKX1_9BACT|nr:TRAP transporter small permease subunit [Desulfofustis glycolicus]MCB2217435.1 TRAP transporter small permease subunit [Desulfobulbaceae bacterium]SHH63675.1 TRAP-type C4-dicarboxylate transport system, small permease component [Desulfofustis glycolicus DSM 9705]